MAEQAAKRQKLASAAEPLLGTHNGTFHCDEALAVYLLRKTAAFEHARLVRTRDPTTLAACDIVVDVGGVYDPGKHRYDHHQRGFDQVFGHGFNTKLSSAGLIYKHFGKEIIARLMGYEEDDERVKTLWLKLYKDYIEAIDGIDNGVNQYPSSLAPAYRSKTDISTRVGWLNPRWNVQVSPADVDQIFLKASALVGDEFIERLDYSGNAWLPARELVEGALNRDSFESAVVVFDVFVPWKAHLFDLEKEYGKAGKTIYILYPDESGKWRIQAVPASPESFESRKPLPEQWRGLRDEELAKVTGVPDAVFVHASGFIGGAQSKAGVEELARLALQS